jgi:hypothetical protein
VPPSHQPVGITVGAGRVAGLDGPYGVTVGLGGTVYVADHYRLTTAVWLFRPLRRDRVRRPVRIDDSGAVTVLTEGLDHPMDVAFDTAGRC